MESRPMWVMVMFDLPVVTKRQRRDANRYRLDLVAKGFQRIQLSVYARFCPTIQRAQKDGADAISALPPEGYCRILYLTDHQWNRMLVVEHKNSRRPEPEPGQLLIFSSDETSEAPANALV